jgi:hypothetical protein
MKKKLMIFIILLTTVGFLSSCDKNKGDFTIEFVNPTNAATVANASNVQIEIKFDSPEELEKIEIGLSVDSSGAADIAPFPLEVHDHVKTKTITQAVDLSGFPAGTAFRLKASSCKNHDCTEKLEQSIRFLIP